MNALLNRITIDPNICFGKPTIRGTRIWVSLILDMLADGMSIAEVLEEYPHLIIEDIQAAIAYSTEMSCKQHADISTISQIQPLWKKKRVKLSVQGKRLSEMILDERESLS